MPLVFDDTPRCRVCNCTDERACPGGCSWVPDPELRGDLCSSCVGRTCERRLIPLKARKMRLCGLLATRKVGNRFFCARHGGEAAGRAARAGG